MAPRAALSLAAHSQAALQTLLDRYQRRVSDLRDYITAYGRNCWPVSGLADLRLAPFHVLASQGREHVDTPPLASRAPRPPTRQRRHDLIPDCTSGR